MRTLLSAGLVAVLIVASCASDDADTSRAVKHRFASGCRAIEVAVGQGDAEVLGVMRRTVPISEDGDGEGVLHLTVHTDCRNNIGSGNDPLATLVVDEPVSFSDDSDEVEFTITGLNDGTYFASGWVDDVDNADQEEDLPATGDLVMFGDLSPRCVQFEVTDGNAAPVLLELDYEMPFTLPGLEGQDGILDGDGTPSVDPSSITDDGNTYRVTVQLTRSVEPDLGGDGTGPWLSTLGEVCFDDESGAPAVENALLLDEVALPETGTAAELVIEDVPNGVYQLNGFIDDVTDPSGQPRPGIGDLVSFGGFGPACAEVVVNGADVTVDFDLNLVMPFDL